MKKMFILFSARTGGRKSEVLRVGWDDITYSEKHQCYLVNFKKTKQKRLGQLEFPQLFMKSCCC